ncbi:XkdW family protein [Paenibacillus thiaminolyticus]|uniref:XkdW family protein n=1 Tax=Paenibacillus thiaminolyticus TaxID=49283 RepID=UPI0035A6A5EC
MKEAIITDLSGRYIEPTLVADSVTGVFDRRERVEPDEPDTLPQPEPEQRDDDQPEEPETVLVGYTVAVPMPDGLYQPIFDMEGYRTAEKEYEATYADYMAALAEHDPESDDPQPEPPQPVDGQSFWRNGLTDEEIQVLNSPPQPSQIDMLGEELAQMKIKNIQQQSVVNGLGAELTKAKLEIINLKGGQLA